MPSLPAIAVIADAHVHDINSTYEIDGVCIDGEQLCLRSWRDTRRSSRVFNESKAALEAALHNIKDRGITHVVLLGDYTDDGQIEATDRFVTLIRRYREQFGFQFFALPGNHDAYGPAGKHQSTRFVLSPGETVLVTSDPEVAAREPDSAVMTQTMYCETQETSLLKMSEFGFFRQTHYLHWETPFGTCDALASRQFTARSADGSHQRDMLDASYLVEPACGLWLLMIDANVFEPRNGCWKSTQKRAFHDSSEAGWSSLLKIKPHLVTWISDVCSRAASQNKALLAFSHYPVIDALNDIDKAACKLFGDHEMHRRTPGAVVANQLLDAGIRTHFSGHLHVNSVSVFSKDAATLKDYATPSLVSFPAGFKIVQPNTTGIKVDTIDLSSMPLDPRLVHYYQRELAVLANTESKQTIQIGQTILAASDYGEFLYNRMQSRVVHHYLEREWPEQMATWVLTATTDDLFELLAATHRSTVQPACKPSCFQSCSVVRLVSDWYCLRHANELALNHIPEHHYATYSYLAERFGDLTPEEMNTPESFFSVLLGMMKKSLEQAERESLVAHQQTAPETLPRQDHS